jgi:phospholipid-binding lipoprotein MlaA
MLLAYPAKSLAASPDDPFEPFNRGMYALHQGLDHVIFGPAARAYKTVIPKPIRQGIRNVIDNLKEPAIAFNDLLQAHPIRAGQTTGRFLLNTTAGVGGVFDVAKKVGIPHHDNGFGETAGRYNVGPGPYLFIPFIGPSNFRDLLGLTADIVTDPLGWIRVGQLRGEVLYARPVLDGLDLRAESDDQLKAIDDMSTDPYASLRSLFEQNRAAQIQDAISGTSGSATPPLDDLLDPGAAPAPAQPAPVPAAPAVPPAPASQPSAILDRGVQDMLARPLRLVSGRTLEARGAG